MLRTLVRSAQPSGDVSIGTVSVAAFDVKQLLMIQHPRTSGFDVCSLRLGITLIERVPTFGYANEVE